jgi:hypothetical protein
MYKIDCYKLRVQGEATYIVWFYDKPILEDVFDVLRPYVDNTNDWTWIVWHV